MLTLTHRFTLLPCLVTAAVLVLDAPAATQSVADDSATLSRIDAITAGEANAGLFSGALLIARGDRILIERQYGFASWELRSPITASTRLGIGSITKVMTEVVVGRLVAEGKLDLDAPASRYLGAFPTGPKGGVVTVRHLFNHRAGVPFRVTDALDETSPLHPADIVERTRAKGLLFEPGEKELYSSAGFSCLARIIELIEGKPFETVLRDRIFTPASMTTATDETGQQLMPQRALSYRLASSQGAVTVASTSYKNLGFLIGAGSVYATATDLLKFARASHNGVFGAQGKALVAAAAGQTWQSWYGRTDGYEASVDLMPSSELTFVLLSNLRSGATWQIREQVKSLLLGKSAAAITRPPTPLAASFEASDAVLGAYGDPADPVLITKVDGHMFRDESEFYPIAGDRYYIGASGSTFRFRRGANGVVDAMLTRSPWATEERVAARLR